MTLADRGPGGGVPGRLAAWLETLGPLAAERPPPSLGQAAAAAGGGLVALAVLILGGDRWATNGHTAQGIVLTLGLLGGSVAAIVGARPPLSTAGVAAAGLAAPGLAFFLAAGEGFPSLRDVAVLGGILLAGLYFVGPWRGHTFHLALLVVAGWVLAITVGDLGFDRSGQLRTVGDTLTSAGAASMVVGVVYLGLASWLHDEGLRGVATPFLAVAAVALPGGAVFVVRDADEILQSVVVVAAGAALAVVGGRCRRRGSTWIGVAVVAAGAVRVTDGVTDSTAFGAVIVALAGVALVAGAPRLATLVGEPAGTVEPPEPPADDMWAPSHLGAGEPAADQPPIDETISPHTTVRRRRRPPTAPPEDPTE